MLSFARRAPFIYLAAALSCLGEVGKDVSLTRVTPVPSDQIVPALDFLRPHLFENPRLNPAGTWFAAFIKNQHFTSDVLICEISTGKFKWSDERTNVTGFFWINDDQLLIDTQAGGQLHGKSLEKIEANSTLRNVGEFDKIQDMRRFHKDEKFGIVDGTEQVLFAPFPVLKHGWPDGGLAQYWVRPENGVLDFCLLENDGLLTLYGLKGAALEKSPINPEDIVPLDAGAMPGQMLALGPRQEGKPRAIQYVDVATGALGKVLFQDPQYDSPIEIVHRPGTWEVIGISIPHKAEHTTWLDPNRQRVQEMINHFFLKSVGSIISANRTEDRFLIREDSDVKPPTYYLLDLQKKSIGLLKNEGPWIDPARMRPMQVLSYKARDGAVIEGYLTLPAGASKEHPAPMVVLPHSGPWSRDVWGWRGDVQFLASRGYAVFQPNYRGSAGYDWRFAPGDRWDFSKMSDDVTDGTKALIKTGFVAPDRIAIMGFGFGGYLAVRGAEDEPGLYRCAITLGGAFDWEEAFDSLYGPSNTAYSEIREHLKVLNPADKHYAGISPMLHTEKIRIPIFITNNFTNHASDDITTIATQTYELSRLIPRGVPSVVFGDLHLNNEDDAFADLVERFEKIEAFLASYLAAAPPVAAR
jgi:pimeloyl-ACP methyl ester carboxylesterase